MNAQLGDIVSTYEEFRALPVGTGVKCARGYWRGRKYVKTSEYTWARVFTTDWRQHVDVAVRNRLNSVSPCPHDDPYRVVLLPRTDPLEDAWFPGLREALGRLTILPTGSSK